MACSSPVHPPKKFKQKSVAGRKVKISPQRVVVEAQEVTLGLPSGKMQAIRGGMKFERCMGASFQQRVASRGRGAVRQSAVTGVGCLGVRQEGAHVRSDTRASRRIRKQALLPSEYNGERGERALKERSLGGEDKMAAPIVGDREAIIVISDEDEGQGEQMGLESGSCRTVLPLAQGMVG
ncbi:hypothetical protein NDU88_004107 [Pleurodeles waltl]|uniref:Uncharacterized protein n=1 Tax=Pleurodeles waltl TaxID=8319 RepID=A0AAV7MT14_PLEWA|nr:hypothetical protein NDU88_004107 [Pleurodeles waltl]